nr:uncharacterized protein LOC109620131 [Crassostrea gigas]
MEADRMCRLLKIDHPPPYVKVVKSSWLSACIKQKQLVDSVAYELDVSWLSRTRKHENKSDTESEEGKVSEEKKEVKPATLCHSYKKPKTQDIEGEDPDSDYAPSDGEGPDEVQGPSVSATSSTSPEKLIALCIQMEHVTEILTVLIPLATTAVKVPRGVALMSTYVPQPKLVLATSGSVYKTVKSWAFVLVCFLQYLVDPAVTISRKRARGIRQFTNLQLNF